MTCWAPNRWTGRRSPGPKTVRPYPCTVGVWVSGVAGGPTRRPKLSSRPRAATAPLACGSMVVAVQVRVSIPWRPAGPRPCSTIGPWTSGRLSSWPQTANRPSPSQAARRTGPWTALASAAGSSQSASRPSSPARSPSGCVVTPRVARSTSATGAPAATTKARRPAESMASPGWARRLLDAGLFQSSGSWKPATIPGSGAVRTRPRPSTTTSRAGAMPSGGPSSSASPSGRRPLASSWPASLRRLRTRRSSGSTTVTTTALMSFSTRSMRPEPASTTRDRPIQLEANGHSHPSRSRIAPSRRRRRGSTTSSRPSLLSPPPASRASDWSGATAQPTPWLPRASRRPGRGRRVSGCSQARSAISAPSLPCQTTPSTRPAGRAAEVAGAEGRDGGAAAGAVAAGPCGARDGPAPVHPAITSSPLTARVTARRLRARMPASVSRPLSLYPGRPRRGSLAAGGSARRDVEGGAGLALRDLPQGGHGVPVAGAPQQRPADRWAPVDPAWRVEGAADGAGVGGRPQQGEGALGRGHAEALHGGAEEALAAAAAGLADAARLQVGVGEPRVDDDAPGRRPGGPEAAVELQGEVHVGQLRLPVGPPGIVAPGQVGVGRVERPPGVAAGAGDRDHAGAVAGQQGRQQQGGEGEVAEVVDGQLHLEPVLGPPLGDAHQAGVVDQDVDAPVAGQDPLGRLPHRGLGGEVQWLQLQRGVGDLVADRRHRRLGLGLVAGGHHHVAALAGQLPGHLQAEAAVGAGDDGDGARLVGDLGGGPGHALDATPAGCCGCAGTGCRGRSGA